MGTQIGTRRLLVLARLARIRAAARRTVREGITAEAMRQLAEERRAGA